MAQRVGRGIALLFHDRGTRRVSNTRVKGRKEERKKVSRKEKERENGR